MVEITTIKIILSTLFSMDTENKTGIIPASIVTFVTGNISSLRYLENLMSAIFRSR